MTCLVRLAVDEIGYLAYDNHAADLLFQIVARCWRPAPCTGSSRGRVCAIYSVRRALELAPANWGTTLQDPQVTQRLEANIFRHATPLPEPQYAAA